MSQTTDETEDPSLPATRPTPTPEVLRAPVGPYPVPTVPLVPEVESDSPYRGVSMLELTPAEAAILTGELPVEWFDILPSGEPYLPWPYYTDLLNQAFGPGRWGLVPHGDVEKQVIPGFNRDGKPGRDKYVLTQYWALYARGHFVNLAKGGQEWIPNNPRHSFDDALEALKSNALMRCMKLWVTDPWKKAWRERFVAEHALHVFVLNDEGKIEAKWRLKAGKPLEGYVTDSHGNRRWGVIERGPVSKPKEAIPPVATATDDPVDSRPPAEQSSGGVGGSGGVREDTRVLGPDPRPAMHPDANPDFVGEMAEDLAEEMREAENKLRRDRQAAVKAAPKSDAPVESFIGVISDAQHKGLWAEAHRTWGDDCSDPLHALIERYGFKSTKQIKRVALPAIQQAMARIQAEPVKPEPPPAKPAARLVPRRVRR